ncbi:MAG TPA: hypothetical protein VHZ54_16030 [Solirubrobacterales bacterium]|jgi:hypothetical protein|nr:hypothetical protein [Solirubrobacterales bacterium]
MAPNPTKIPGTLKPIAEELLENSYARENLTEGAEKLRDAYERSRKRRVKPSKDRKLRRQLEAAIAALDEGTAALASGRKKPKRTGRNLVLVLIGAVLAGAAAVLATNEDLRNQALGAARSLGDEITGGSDEEAAGSNGGGAS